MYEVELKFVVTDVAAIGARFQQIGATRLGVVGQCDLYFGHPARSFANSDEALRVRSTDESHHVTYKGPVIDDATKMRREIEIGLQGDEQSAADFKEMLCALGFEPVREVKKRRQRFQLHWFEREFELAIDEVAELGTFVELETLATADTRDHAREAVLHLAEQCELRTPEKRSYLRMLLEQDAQQSPAT